MADKDKIADEIMNEEELDGVSGGGCAETALDSRFLNCLNGSTDRYGETKLNFFRNCYKFAADETKKAWATLGIDVENDNFYKENKYYIDGREITQEDARIHAMRVTGHFMKRKEWDW